jgi:phage terminase large subunit-like protein
VAQDTYESTQKDVYKHYFPPPVALDFALKKDRELIFRWNYSGSPWVDVRSIESESVALAETNPAEAERFFGNRIVAGSGHWVSEADWVAKAVSTPIFVSPRTRVCLGFDGSDNNDWTGIRLETLEYYQFTPTYLDKSRPTLWKPDTTNGNRINRAEVMAAMDEIATEFEIVRAYCDPMFWETEIDTWAAKYGDKTFIKWPTNSIGRMHGSLERFRTDITNPDSDFRHDGDLETKFHVRNAIIRARPGQKYIVGKPADHQKIDQLMSSTLAHEAVCDAIADGALSEVAPEYVYF